MFPPAHPRCNVLSELLSRYADECLSSSFDGSGLALQDVVNELGARLGFQVHPGLYRGKSGAVGFDGIWSASDGHKVVVEVKTTDTYRINLDTVAGYRSTLVNQDEMDKIHSSVLIVVSRQDTGDLEAQIRGSRHAWDVRLLSVDALLKLMAVRENLTDEKTAQQIVELLKPMEYTRVDQLVEIVFSTSEDLQSEAPTEEELAEPTTSEKTKLTAAANFHDECIERVSKHLKISLIKEGKNRYTSPGKSLGVSCAVSKEYPKPGKTEYWFAFHTSQLNYLSEKQEAYACYGCGSPEKVLLLPFGFLEPLLDQMYTTDTKTRLYWHIHLFEHSGKWELGLGSGGKRADVTQFAAPMDVV